jgi:DNA-binding transcriptional MerR regulator
MRMAELSRRSGVPTGTIKYYLREGLLPAGRATAPNQAEYDQEHLDRLSLLRALREAAGLPIATIARVFAAMEVHQEDAPPAYLSIAVGALSEPLVVPEDQVKEYGEAQAQVADLLDTLGWDVDTDSPGYDDLVRALVGVHTFLPGLINDTKQLLPYGMAVRSLADVEIPETYDPAVDRAAVLRFSVLGTVLFEPVLLALRRLAHTDRIRHTAATRRRRSASHRRR